MAISINTDFIFSINTDFYHGHILYFVVDTMRRFCLILFILLACGSRLFAQSGSGLKAGADTAAINLLISRANNTPDPDSAIALFEKVLRLSIDAGYADGAFRALITKSMKYYEKENFTEERLAATDALKWAPAAAAKDATAWCYNNIGDSYINEGDYIHASEYCYKALDELKKNNVPLTHTTANVYLNLGLVNIRLGLPAKALDNFRHAEDISRRAHLDRQLANSLANIGEYYSINHKPDSAIPYFNEMMQIGVRLGKVDIQAIANDNLGRAYVVRGDYSKAVPLLQLAISLASNRYPYIVVDASYALGDALCRIGRYNDAERILIAALNETKAHNLKDNYAECYGKLVTFYKTTKNYKKALDYTDSLMVLKDSLTSAEKANAIAQMEQKYKNAETDRSNAERDKKLTENELVIARQSNKIVRKNVWIAGISGSVVLLIVIGIALYRNASHRQRLQAEQIKSLQQENTISILKGVVQGEEKERSRLARELHDGIGGMLSAIIMRLSSLRHDKTDINSVPAYSEAMQLLNEMGDEIRIAAHNLMPEVLLKQPLQDAIRTYCNHIMERSAMEVDFQSYGSFENLSQNSKLNIYRIVQELLKNVLQHAGAAHVLVQLAVNEHLLTITVEDNGKGFNTDEVKKGIGLHNLRTRVHSMHGQITTKSMIGRGTSVYIEFDIKTLSPEADPGHV